MEVEDRQAIMDLIYEYSYAYDENDIKRFSNLFTENGTWDSPIGTARSREAIYDLLADRRGRIANRGIQNRHFQTNTILDSISVNQAKGRTMVMVTWQYPDEQHARVHLTGYYEDEFVKTTEGWKFLRRVLYIDQSPHDLDVER